MGRVCEKVAGGQVLAQVEGQVTQASLSFTVEELTLKFKSHRQVSLLKRPGDRLKLKLTREELQVVKFKS